MLKKVSSYLKKYAKSFPILLLIALIGIASWVFAARMTSRNSGSLVLSKKRVLESNWGGNLVQNAPMLDTNYRTQRVVNSIVGNTAQPDLKRQPVVTATDVKITKSDIDVVLNMDYRRKGLTYFPTYITDLSAVYTIKNDNDEDVEASIRFPLPAKDNLVWNVGVTADDQDEGARITPKEVMWTGEIEANQEKQVTVTYSARGLDDFSYALASSNGLQDFTLDIAVNGADKIDFPDGALSPTEIVEKDNGWDLHWKFDNVLTSPSITVKMFAKKNISEQIAKLFWFLPFLLVAYVVGLYGFSFLNKKGLSTIDYSIMIILYSIFYPFLAYLVSIFDTLNVFQGLAISFVVINTIALYFYGYLFGSKKALSQGLILELMFLGFFPFALLSPQFTGFLAVIGVIVTMITIIQLRMGFGKKK